jgi:hypothetical protein
MHCLGLGDYSASFDAELAAAHADISNRKMLAARKLMNTIAYPCATPPVVGTRVYIGCDLQYGDGMETPYEESPAAEAHVISFDPIPGFCGKISHKYIITLQLIDTGSGQFDGPTAYFKIIWDGRRPNKCYSIDDGIYFNRLDTDCDMLQFKGKGGEAPL